MYFYVSTRERKVIGDREEDSFKIYGTADVAIFYVLLILVKLLKQEPLKH